MLDLSHLRTFLEVYRQGSLTKAAAALHLSQPTVTQHVRALEAQVGAVLFERTARGITATGHAHDLAARSAGPLDELAAVSAAQGAAHSSGTLHVGGPAEFLASRVAPALAPLAEDGIRIQEVDGLVADLLEQLANGALDLVVALSRNDDRRLRFQLLVEEPLLLVAAADRAQEDVESIPLVAFDERLPLIRAYFLHVFGREPNQDVIATFPSQDAIRSFVVAGGGMAVMPRYIAAPALEAGTLALVHEPDDPPHLAYYLATRVAPSVSLVERAVELIQTAGR